VGLEGNLVNSASGEEYNTNYYASPKSNEIEIIERRGEERSIRLVLTLYIRKSVTYRNFIAIKSL
jgi:hypothetical protein